MTMGSLRRHVILCATIAFGAAVLTPAATGQTISGTGTRACSVFIIAVERDSEAALDSYLSWAQGFVSGVNATNAGRDNFSIDHAGLFHWLVRYCRANGDAMIYEALLELVDLPLP